MYREVPDEALHPPSAHDSIVVRIALVLIVAVPFGLYMAITWATGYDSLQPHPIIQVTLCIALLLILFAPNPLVKLLTLILQKRRQQQQL